MKFSLEASGTSLEDVVSEMDEESGALFGRAMESLHKLTNICSKQAAIIDRIENTINQINDRTLYLVEQNESLSRKLQVVAGQNENLKKELEELTPKKK